MRRLTICFVGFMAGFLYVFRGFLRSSFFLGNTCFCVRCFLQFRQRRLEISFPHAQNIRRYNFPRYKVGERRHFGSARRA